MERIHIVVATNNKYAKHLAVMLTSLFDNKKSKNPSTIYIIDGNLSEDNKKKLVHSVKMFQTDIKFLKVDESLYKNVKVHYHLTKETYYRISIPSLLGGNIHKALYLDCDVIFKEDITQLWDTDVGNYELAAVQIPGYLDRYRALSIPKSNGYFNAGVLVMNVKKWRENKTSDKVMKVIHEIPGKLRFMDQDALNIVLQKKWMKLNPKWNYQVHRYRHQTFKPALIHYTTARKPWNGNPKFKEEYVHYLQKTVW